METGFWLTVGFWLALLVDFIIRVLAIIIVPRNRKPTSATAWLLAINISHSGTRILSSGRYFSRCEMTASRQSAICAAMLA